MAQTQLAEVALTNDIEDLQPLTKTLPLVLEIIPGQAGEGLIDVYEPGTYDGRSVRELVERTLAKDDWSVEDRQILEDIRKQLSGGKLLINGQEIEGAALEHVVLEETEEGERYLFLPIRAIKPQEGGCRTLNRVH